MVGEWGRGGETLNMSKFIIQCIICGKTIKDDRKPPHTRYKYCSTRCARKNGRRKLSQGKLKAVFIRAGASCEKCGSQKGLNIHHILPVEQGGEDEVKNLELICRKCHIKAHPERNWKQ